MNQPSTLSRALAPLAGFSWALFIVTSVLVAIVWVTGFGEGMLEEGSFKRAIPNPELRSSLVLFSHAIDPVWITLGAVAIYLSLARSEGLATARRWAVVIMTAGFIVTLLSVRTQWPLGPVHYPENLGWTIGPVPFGIPLLWFVVIAGSRELALRIFPRAKHSTIAGLMGCFSGLTMLNLDPIAWKYRAWWLWYPRPFEGSNRAPLQNYGTWIVAALILGWFMRSMRVVPDGAQRPWAPVIVWATLNGVVLLTQIALRVR
jgi:uncharacterized membrane protein